MYSTAGRASAMRRNMEGRRRNTQTDRERVRGKVMIGRASMVVEVRVCVCV